MSHRPSLKIGDYTVTAFSDGVFETSLDVTVGIDKTLTQRVTGKTLADPVYLSVNAFLVEGRGIRALIDAGSGETMGPALGKLPENLQSAGVGLDTITHILLTHIHPDHSNGLIDGAGNPWFRKAELVVQETEIKFWFDRDISQAAHARQRANMINAKKSLTPYVERTTRIHDGPFLPGIHAMMSPGHTPGHNTWTIEGGGESLIVWGDTIHMAFLQLIHPEAAFVFDTDPQMAVASRLSLLERVRADRTRIAGMHLDFPGFGFVTRSGERYCIETD